MEIQKIHLTQAFPMPTPTKRHGDGGGGGAPSRPNPELGEAQLGAAQVSPSHIELGADQFELNDDLLNSLGL